MIQISALMCKKAQFRTPAVLRLCIFAVENQNNLTKLCPAMGSDAGLYF